MSSPSSYSATMVVDPNKSFGMNIKIIFFSAIGLIAALAINEAINSTIKTVLPDKKEPNNKWKRVLFHWVYTAIVIGIVLTIVAVMGFFKKRHHYYYYHRRTK